MKKGEFKLNDKKEEIELMVRKGLSLRKIAQALQTDKSNIRYFCRQNNIDYSINLRFTEEYSKLVTKQELSDLLTVGYGLQRIGKIIGLTIGGVCYWMKKYGLKCIRKYNTGSCNQNYMNCKICGTKTQFVYNNLKICLCAGCKTQTKRRALKRRLVLSKGGACEICGYNRSLNALDFHHLDSEEKDNSVSNYIQVAGNFTKAVKEAEKCMLVCSNCHREIHDKTPYGEFIDHIEIVNFVDQKFNSIQP
ncbi:MAG: hypothetical protein AAB456_02400 [Patescibacteria group bacterium]